MIVIAALALLQTVTPPASRRPPDEPVQTHGQNVVVKHDPIGGAVDIVAENVGACPGPGPTTIMRLRSADKARTLAVTVAKSVNVRGAITTTTATYSLAPLGTADLGCLAQPAPGGGKPLSTTEWKIVRSRAQ